MKSDSKEIEDLLGLTRERWEECIKHFGSSSQEVNLMAAGIKPLFESKARNQSGLIVSFLRNSKISACSGIKFYSDELGINQVGHKYAGKEKVELRDPLFFNSGEVYYSYYTNTEILPAHLQGIQPISLPALVTGVGCSWTCASWLSEILSSILAQEKKVDHLFSLCAMAFEAFQAIRGPLAIKQLLVKLIFRMVMRIRDTTCDGPAFAQFVKANTPFFKHLIELLTSLKAIE